MRRKKETQGPNSQRKASEPLPAGRQTNEGLSEETARSGYPDSFFSKGIVKSFAGTCNVLLVAPNMSPDTDDNNIGLLTCWLAESLGAYAVINCKSYRKPIEGDPTPEELEVSHGHGRTREDQRILKLHQRLREETGAIPVDLDSFYACQTVAYDYLETVWWNAKEIGLKASPQNTFPGDLR